ncbi:MAG TPA: RNA-protein complex protein Nop10 [Candidatus Bathyarchaeia archaeon]|nr:RNA-protein complex protein Nop10 [Candidatus Bathyarchaeia archaeon]
MKWLMRRCPKCSRYTLKETCPACGAPTENPHPPKFSPDDKYARQRMEGSSGPSEVQKDPLT